MLDTIHILSLLVVVCNTSTGGSMFPTSSFLSALIKLPKNAVCQVCQLWKWLLLLLDNETWVPYYLSCATRSGFMKGGYTLMKILGIGNQSDVMLSWNRFLCWIQWFTYLYLKIKTTHCLSQTLIRFYRKLNSVSTSNLLHTWQKLEKWYSRLLRNFFVAIIPS